MTNFDILQQNKDISSELIKMDLKYDQSGAVEMKLDYDYIETISMLSYNNRIFYEKNLIIKGSVIYEQSTSQHYIAYFDPMIYYENTQVKYEAVFNLIRRKHSKEVIIHAMYEMIKSNYSVKIIKVIFNKIVKQLHKNLFNNKNMIGATISRVLQNSQEHEEKRNSYDLSNPRHYMLLRKKTIIRQPDMYYHLFKPFEHKNVEAEYIFQLLVLFVNSLMSYGIPIQPGFQTILINFLKKIKNFSLIGIFLQYHSLPDSVELAKFMLEDCAGVDTIEYDDPQREQIINETKEKAFQFALDMLIRLKKYDEVFIALINRNQFVDALLFMKRYKVNIEYISSDAAAKIKNMIRENRSLVTEFLLER
jgi:hypothetical protein